MDSKLHVALLTALAMLAFAGNSLLCRAALLPGPAGALIDPMSFTVIRLASGALVLAPALLQSSASPTTRGPGGALRAGATLLIYALAFSISYTRIRTGTGALILFGVVQLTMFASASLRGERIGTRRGFGALLAFGGLCLLLAPTGGQLGSVDPLGAALMAVAGVGWGLYTLLGRGSTAPIAHNAVNFLVALPVTLVALGGTALAGAAFVRWEGAALAAASGAVCSGIGYSIWYRALRGHSSVSAAISQLTVPVLAAGLGAGLLAESLTWTWVASAALVLVGVALGLKAPASASKASA